MLHGVGVLGLIGISSYRPTILVMSNPQDGAHPILLAFPPHEDNDGNRSSGGKSGSKRGKPDGAQSSDLKSDEQSAQLPPSLKKHSPN